VRGIPCLLAALTRGGMRCTLSKSANPEVRTPPIVCWGTATGCALGTPSLIGPGIGG